jgi:hypothetical protein
MYMHDLFTTSSPARRVKHVSWPWRRKARSGPGSPVRAPYRRRLAEIERSLVADAPTLSSKFAVFNRLTAGERPVGAERVTRRARLRLT